MPIAPIAMAAASDRPPMIVSAGCLRSIRAPSFQSSHETAFKGPRPEGPTSPTAVIGPYPAGAPEPLRNAYLRSARRGYAFEPAWVLHEVADNHRLHILLYTIKFFV